MSGGEGDALALRPAAEADAARLLAWRNDPVTRRASGDAGRIAWPAHLAWLVALLADPRRRLWIADLEGVPVGTVRAEFTDEGWRLSWTVAPERRGRGLGRRMVAAAAAHLEGRVFAEIKPDNAASLRIARALGLVYVGEVDGLLRFAGPADA